MHIIILFQFSYTYSMVSFDRTLILGDKDPVNPMYDIDLQSTHKISIQVGNPEINNKSIKLLISGQHKSQCGGSSSYHDHLHRDNIVIGITANFRPSARINLILVPVCELIR